MPHKAILLHINDNVATALTDLEEGETIHVSLDHASSQVVLHQEIPFGHKMALRHIAEGEEVLKYGLPIGKALSAIQTGEWVHVHNCRSDRFGFHREEYGLQA